MAESFKTFTYNTNNVDIKFIDGTSLRIQEALHIHDSDGVELNDNFILYHQNKGDIHKRIIVPLTNVKYIEECEVIKSKED